MVATTVLLVGYSTQVEGRDYPAFNSHLEPISQHVAKITTQETTTTLSTVANPLRLTPIEEKRVAVKPSTKRTPNTTNSEPSASYTDELSEARSLLAAQIRKHPILAGATVSFGDARGYQAVSYYKSGRIVISKSHTASLSRIINHEIWHIIDWRDNGVIDWGENVPPR